MGKDRTSGYLFEMVLSEVITRLTEHVLLLSSTHASSAPENTW